MQTYTLKVSEIRKETNDTVTLCFKQPALKKIKYIAGQYLTLIFRINGRRYIRPYSFSSSPTVDNYLEVTVKRVNNGVISNHINDMVKIGDIIETLPPMGDFIYNPNFKKTYLWGVGSGITPLISIAKEALNISDDTQIQLMYGNKSHESTIFKSQLETLQRQYPKRFSVKHFHTKLVLSEDIQTIIEGRIDQNKALQILNEAEELKNIYHYICGPIGLKESLKTALSFYSINSNQIFTEDFELIKNPKDFEDIHTRTVTINFGSEKFDIEVIKGKSILEASLDANIDLNYSCQTGNCSTCMGKLIEGQVKMIGITNDRTDLENNEYLLCCTYPLTEDVYIKI